MMKNYLLLLYIGLIFLIFFGLPDQVMYSKGIVRWVPFILIFIIQPYVLYYLLRSFNVNPDYLLAACALSFLIIGLSFGYYGSYQEDIDFQERGKQTKAVVYKKWYSIKKNSEWLLKCKYVVDGTGYSTFSETDKKNIYKIGDTLTVIYIEEYPQKCRIKELN